MCSSRPRQSAGFTLLEVMIVVVVIAVLAGMLIPSFSASPATQLQSAAGILGRELEYARSLAVSNSDTYKITFDLTNNQTVLTYTGSNSALSTLPISPFHTAAESATQQTLAFGSLPSVGGPVKLVAVWSLANTPQSVTDVEFTALGNTTRSQPTLIWLGVASGAAARYIAVRVNPATGLYWIESYQSTLPNAATYSAS